MRKPEQLNSSNGRSETPFHLTRGNRGRRPQQPAVVPSGLLSADRNFHQKGGPAANPTMAAGLVHVSPERPCVRGARACCI